MGTTRDIYVVSAARTAIGTFGGTLKDSPPIDLATTAIKAATARSGADAAQIGHVAMGTVISTEARDADLGRVASVAVGVPEETPAWAPPRPDRAAARVRCANQAGHICSARHR